MGKKELSADRLHELFSYDPLTGQFTRLIDRGKGKAGTVAGGNRPDGYHRITVDGAKHLTHRLVWLYVHGHWPPKLIDHIDRDPRNNRLANLREADDITNAQNRSFEGKGKRSHTGVSYRQDRGYWTARFIVAGKDRSLGRFETESEAALALMAARQQHYTFVPVAGGSPSGVIKQDW